MANIFVHFTRKLSKLDEKKKPTLILMFDNLKSYPFQMTKLNKKYLNSLSNCFIYEKLFFFFVMRFFS